ncbi:MAG TPA: aspartyl protease family protein [Ferruginibacter sp.]|nr:aspartyl protease family protein [Ferruginibacter sp.]
MKYYLLLLIICFPRELYAQEIFSQPEAAFITRFPFKQFSGGVIVLQANFENIKDSFNFILDTGSGGISLDSSTCKEFSIQTKASDTTITGIGGIRKVHFAFDKTLRLPGLTVRHLNFHINNYEVLSSVYGEKIDGILGYSFLSRFVVKINFDSMFIEVYSPGKMKYESSGSLLHPVFTSLPIQYMHIKDRVKMDYNFYFDTGAGLCFLMSERFAADSGILLKKRKPVLTQAEGMAGRLQMRLTVIREVKIGPYRFRGVPTYLYKDDYNVTSYPFSGGLVGNDLMRRFNMVLNYGQREIHILPNTHYTDPFDYAYTGLGIYYIDGKIIVVDVIDNSPAHKAGLRQGDEIISVANNLSHNIQIYKNMLQLPNQKIKIIISRDKNLYEVLMKTSTIL